MGIVDQGRLQFLGTIDELRTRLSTHETSLERLYLSFTAADGIAPQATTGGNVSAGTAGEGGTS